MTRWVNILLILLFGIGLISCVEEYWPNITKYENLLVVDGLLTNGGDTTVVNLSKSSSINNSKLLPLTGAEVYITDNSGIITQLDEMEIGSYKVSGNDFTGVAGNSYQLHITLPNGNMYESDLCILQEPSPIDSVYALIDSHEVANVSYPQVGLQFYIDNHGNNEDTINYLWRLTQTYKYRASFTLDYYWIGRMVTVSDPDSLRTCWRTKPVYDIFTYSTRYIDNSVIIKYPLNFVSTETKMLSMRYSLFVEQLTVSNRAYLFWDALRQQNISRDNLYSQQPVQIRGNIRNVLNEDEVVLGYFTVAGITNKRIFVNRPYSLAFHYYNCEPDFEAMKMIGASSELDWPVYVTDVFGEGLAQAGSDVCFDCRLEGGSLTPPDFWEE